MNVRLLNDQAHSLVDASVQDMQSGLWQYKTEEDLAMLRIAYIIVRRRREQTKCNVLASKIKSLDAALHGGPNMRVKPKQVYIVIRCAICRDHVGKGKGKMAAISDAKSQGAHIIPIIKDGQRKRTIICHSCYEKNPTVEVYGIVKKEIDHARTN